MIDKILEKRDAIARAIRSVRLACSGRKCLKECQRRMAAAAPCPRAVRSGWGAAVAAALFCLGAFVLGAADVQCVWDGSAYVCSGTGSSIEVIGGGSGLPVVVTNFWGVCTNCVNMSPQDCETIKTYAISEVGVVSRSLLSVLGDIGDSLSYVDDLRNDIYTFRRFGGSPSSYESASFVLCTNYIYTVDNSQTSLVKGNLPSSLGGVSPQRVVSYNNGIYDYAQTLRPTFDDVSYKLNSSSQQVDIATSRLNSLSEHLYYNLVCDECQPGGSPGGSGGGFVTNGNWCTFDQGEAIKDLLRDLKTWSERQHLQLVAISNFVEQSYNTMRDGFFTGYTSIPTEEDLGMSWQELYLSGYSPNFHDYAATNILARIELLLAGMSGVLTNNSDFAQSEEFVENGVEATNRFEAVVSDFTNEVSDVIAQRERNVRSVGASLIGLYEAFRGWSGTPFSRETLVNSYSVEIGDRHWDVPAFEPYESSLWAANLIRVVCRSVMSVIYILFTVAVFIRFHIAFFQWVYKYLRWGVELMQGLFA